MISNTPTDDSTTPFQIVLFFILLLTAFFILHPRIVEPFGLTADSKNQFTAVQHTINPYQIYDLNILETQVNQQDLDAFNQTRRWPWSQETIDLYKQAFNKNPYVRDTEDHAVEYARTIYNENAILRILANQAAEGQFLINGYQDKSAPTQPTVRCKYDGSGLELVERTGVDPITAVPIHSHRDITLQEAAQLIPGFSVTAPSSNCNPCAPLQLNPDYKCSFQLPNTTPSPVWAKLWSNA